MSDKLSVYDFGRKLLETNDLDPVYVLLWEARDHFETDDSNLRAWLLAYWCFYHVGTSSWIHDQAMPYGDGYWRAMETAAGSKEYPRSPERRHFRGENARKSVAYLKERGLESLFGEFDRGYEMRVAQITAQVEKWVGFGPWIAFKVADMLERLAVFPVDFSRISVDSQLYKSPREGAELLWKQTYPNEAYNGNPSGWAINQVVGHLKNLDAPPRYERKINAQEAETVLCKWKSYMGGHYEIGEDIHACRRSLLRFSRSRTAQVLLRAGKIANLWP